VSLDDYLPKYPDFTSLRSHVDSAKRQSQSESEHSSSKATPTGHEDDSNKFEKQ
jgi:hypothetical protein